MRFIYLKQTNSTNSYARSLAENGDLGPLWVCADVQSKGRGRRGRRWVSKAGNLFTSGLYVYDAGEVKPGWYSFVAAIAVYETINFYLTEQLLDLKWPNDVLAGGEKIAGILLETGQNEESFWIVVGIGINLISQPDTHDIQATHLAELIDNITPPKPKVVLKRLVSEFAKWDKILREQGFSEIRQAWLARCQGLPGPVKVNLASEQFDGYAKDLGDMGELIVQLPDGTLRSIYAGDVFFEKGAA